MSGMSTAEVDQIFDSLGRCLTVEAATNLQEFRVGDDLQRQLDEWADKSCQGILDAAEREQYESVLRTLNLVAVLQAKARKLILENGPK